MALSEPVPNWKESLDLMIRTAPASPEELQARAAAWLRVRKLVDNCTRPYHRSVPEDVLEDAAGRCMVKISELHGQGKIDDPNRLPGFVERDLYFQMSAFRRERGRYAEMEDSTEDSSEDSGDSTVESHLARARARVAYDALDEISQTIVRITEIEDRSVRDAFESYGEMLANLGIKSVNQLTHQKRVAMAKLSSLFLRAVPKKKFQKNHLQAS